MAHDLMWYHWVVIVLAALVITCGPGRPHR